MSRTYVLGLGFMLAISSSLPAMADIDTSPYLLSELGATASGQFEWDEFVAPPSSIAPDVASVGGTATVSASDYVSGPGPGPTAPLVTTSGNLYTADSTVNFDVSLAGLASSEAFTTVVLQIGVQGAIVPSSLLLDGAAPTEFFNRGTANGVQQNTDAVNLPSLSSVSYYWAEWQVAGANDYLIEFTNAGPHTSFTQLRVDYVNSDNVFNAVAPSQVPEPSAMALLGLAGLGLVAARFRYRTNN